MIRATYDYRAYVPYPSPELLKAAAADLADCHALTIVTIPALLRAQHSPDETFLDSNLLPTIKGFGSAQEKPVLEAFRLRDNHKSPYLAVWQDPPVFIRSDYPGSTLQRQRTSDLIGQELFNIAWNEGHTKRIGTALRPDAGRALAQRHVKPVSRLSLALWLGRHEDLHELEEYMQWFDENFPTGGTDLDSFYTTDTPNYVKNAGPMEGLLWIDMPDNDDIIKVIAPPVDEPDPLDVPSTTPPREEVISVDEPDDSDDLRWTRDFCAYPLRDADVARITEAVLSELDRRRVALPNARDLVTRCVTALLVGHLILQGPPGTGKTTLARILADAFDVLLLESTATSEWSPFHVIGGLRPSSDGSLQPSYGKVSDAALKCAVHVRTDVTAEAEGDDDKSAPRRKQGAWLLVDEFNRADIDKAIGSLYTMLSSCDAKNLERSPIDLWFESEGRQHLWVPSRFRIIAAMNDLDTSFVNPISQGLTRRFQFVTVGAPSADGESAEVDNAMEIAHDWLSETYGAVLKVNQVEEAKVELAPQIASLGAIIGGLRQTTDTVAGWPVGTAQVVDVLRIVLLRIANGSEPADALDWSVADRLVPQMGQLDEFQLTRAAELFEQSGLTNAQTALRHLLDPHTV